MKLALSVFSVTIFVSFNIYAQLYSIKSHDLSNTKSPKLTKSHFYKMKSFAGEQKWKECIDSYHKAIKEQKKLEAWIIRQAHICGNRISNEEVKYTELSKIIKETDVFFKKKIQTAISANQLLVAQIESIMNVLDLGLKRKQFETASGILDFKYLLELLDSNFLELSKEQKAKLYYYYAESALINHNLIAASQYLDLSLQEKESKIAQEKYQNVKLALGDRAEKNQKTESTFVNEKSESEQKLELILENYLKQKDLISYLEEGVSFLNTYPNGKSASLIQDRILNIYSEIKDKELNNADDEKNVILKKKALTSIQKIESVRALQWIKYFHRKGDYGTAFKLCEKNQPSYHLSLHSSTFYYLYGRSAEFLGKYDKAEKSFLYYLEANSGGDDWSEVQFRLGLVYVRLKNYSAAIAAFEKLLNSKKVDRYELSSRYWMYRSMVMAKNPRAEVELKLILEKYPITYYGLILNLESSQGLLKLNDLLDTSKMASSTIYLSRFQKETLDRVKILGENNWESEAQKELSQFTFPRAAQLKSELAYKLATSKNYPSVIRLVNESIDIDPSLRSLDLINISFPNLFEESIKDESLKYNLSPFLVKSLIRQESAFGIQAVSSSNALGLMQLIPPTALEVSQELKSAKVQMPDDMFDPQTNIKFGTYYIAKMIGSFKGFIPAGLAAYNAGPTRLNYFFLSRLELSEILTQSSWTPMDDLWMDELPWSETSFYVKSILRNSVIYRFLGDKKKEFKFPIWADLVNSPEKTAHH